MSTTVVPFDFKGTQVRVVVVDGVEWLVASDAAAALTLRDTSSALKMVEPEDQRSFRRSDTPQFFEGFAPQVQVFTAINEPGLYSLVFQSNKPEAQQFRRWVTGTVLPQIRRTGSYSSAPALTPAERMAIGLQAAREVLAERDAQIAILAPKAEVADRFLDADGDLAVADAAKALTRAGVKVGEGRLFNALADRRWIYRSPGDGRWRVCQSAIESGVMSVIPQSHYHPKTGVLVLDPPQPRVTPKGLQKLLAAHGAEVSVA